MGALGGIVAVAAGRLHALALTSTGTVYAWGRNAEGELGDATTTARTSPVLVSGLTSVRSIAAGRNISLAVKQDETTWDWGTGLLGQLGDGASILTAQTSTPFQVQGASNMTTAAATADSSAALGVSRAGATTTYSYDKLYRLTGVTAPTGTSSYTYDPTGNRLSKVLGGQTTNSTYDKADRILTAGTGDQRRHNNRNVHV